MKPLALVRLVPLLLALCVVAGRANADNALPRHGILGIAVADQSGHVVVTTVLPGSVAAAAGIRPGDQILQLDGKPVPNVRDFLLAIRRPARSPAALEIERGGTPMVITAMLKAPPDEHDPDVDTIYGALSFQGTLRRTLVTLPHGSAGRHPAALLIGGIGCFSVDVAGNPSDPYMNLTHDLTRKGFVTMRLEKSGVGDSQGPPCETVDFVTESASYEAALQALAANPAVDPQKIYLIGHSIGTIIAPRLAEHHAVAGLVVADGVGRDWYEYELLNSRGQWALAGLSPDDVDGMMLRTERCKYRILVAREPKAQILAEEPDCKGAIAYPVTATYLQQVAALNVAEPWTKLAVPVLIIYGTGDFITLEEDHRRIYAIVSAAHPGNATLRLIDGMDHYLTPAGSQQASYDRVNAGKPAPYDPRFSETIIAWLCTHERCS
jgi:pimeloyl-ACP methyl ester carboxylesterase